MPTDPICGMHVSERSHLKLESDGETYYFCSSNCKLQFSSPEAEEKLLRYRLIVAWTLSIPIMILSYVLPYSFTLKGIILLITATPVQFYSGYGFYSGTYMAIRERAGNMDLLVATGSTIAYFVSLYYAFILLSGSRAPLFFDASSMIITLILTGSYIESRAKKGANRSANKLAAMLPSTVTRLKGDEQEKVPFESLIPGDVVVVKAGEIVPVDGDVMDGRADMDNSIITGEQNTILVQAGDHINSGAMNLNGVLRIKASQVGKDNTILQMRSMIQKASSSHIKVQRTADIFSAVFIKIVLISAFISSIFWFFFLYHTGNTRYLEIAILAFVSVVVVACPCAIGLATPITLLITANMASENGILFRDSGCLERLSKTSMVVFDKTGTITTDRPQVKRFHVEGKMDAMDIYNIMYSTEINSRHPVAVAIASYCKHMGAQLVTVQHVVETPGVGISGIYGRDRISIIRNRSTEESSVRLDMNDVMQAEVTLEYSIRDGSREVVEQLHSMGIETSLLTGDAEAEARRIGKELNMDMAIGALKPEDKADVIHKMQEKGHYVMFIGDGINDAPALEMADVSVVMGSGSDIARESGDIILLNNNLNSILLIRDLGRASIGKIRENIGWAVGYNAVLIPVAGGLLYPLLGLGMFTVLPMFAALAMGLSSTSVVLNSLRMRNDKRISYGIASGTSLPPK